MTDAEIQKNIEENPHYCKVCGSCGESGCCSPSNCEEVRCKYGEHNIREYEDLLNENEKYRKAVEILIGSLSDSGYFGADEAIAKVREMLK